MTVQVEDLAPVTCTIQAGHNECIEYGIDSGYSETN
jgi:hypothetical protein